MTEACSTEHFLWPLRASLQIFNGPWTGVEISRFVHNRCTRASRIGRAFVGDIFASQFVRATDVNKQQEVLKGLRKLQWQYREGRTQPEVQQRLRYYEDLIDVWPLADSVAICTC